MEFAHSFWSAPLLNKRFNSIEDSLRINMPLYAASVACIHFMGHKITLYADEVAAEIFSHIPYDKVVIINNTITDDWHLAASIKFCALQHMPLDTIHIDGDIILHKPAIYEQIKNSTADITVSFFEPKDYVKNNVNPFIFETCRNLPKPFEYPYCTPQYSAIEGWLNTSLMKFTSEKLKQEYIEQYIKHAQLVSNVDFKGGWADIVIEQLHLSSLVREHDYTVERLIKDYPMPSAEQYARNVGFAHVGAMKRQMAPTIVMMLKLIDKELHDKTMRHVEAMCSKYASAH